MGLKFSNVGSTVTLNFTFGFYFCFLFWYSSVYQDFVCFIVLFPCFIFYVSITISNFLFHEQILKIFQQKFSFLISRFFLSYNTLPHISGNVLCFHVGHIFVCPYVCLSIRTLFPFDNKNVGFNSNLHKHIYPKCLAWDCNGQHF